jgi:hypothetical protein
VPVANYAGLQDGVAELGGPREGRQLEGSVLGVVGGKDLASPFGVMVGELAALDSEPGDQLSRAADGTGRTWRGLVAGAERVWLGGA